MKLKIGGSVIVWIFAISMAVIYFVLPPSSQIKIAKEQEELDKQAQKEYVLYLPKGKQEFQTKTVQLDAGLQRREEIRAIIQANLDVLHQLELEPQKIELGNIYEDGKILYLTFNFKFSVQGQAALKKTLAALGIEQEVRVLGNGK